MKNKKLWLYIGFFAVLVLGFYFAVSQFMDVRKSNLPVLGFVRPFSFTKQDAKNITEKDIDGKVCVAEFFFTTCKGICPKMNNNMKKIYAVYKNDPNFLILSHTVDPKTDTVERMKKYADSLGADPLNWYFLTGSKESLYKAARESYLLDDEKNSAMPINEQFVHTQLFALVDKNGRIRGMIYDGLKQEEIDKLIGDIKELLSEPKEEKRFVNSLFQNNPN